MSNDEQGLVATSSQTVGPFFHVGLTALAEGRVVSPGKGNQIELLITVTDGDGQPVPDAIVELWQAHGAASAFGRMPTSEDGTSVFTTVRPEHGDQAVPPQAPHINVCLFARGLLRHLHTRIYFAGDPALAADPVLALVPEDRRATLLATPDAADSGRWQFHVRLQGPEETVFFNA
jgi:protocatechuate 3,4-dioxygenase alpha subunit